MSDLHQPAGPLGQMAFDAGPPVLPALWAAKWSIAVTALCAALIGFGVSALQPTTYTATAELLLVDPRNTGVFDESGVNFLDPSRYVRNQAELARSTPVITEASRLIGGRLSSDDVAERVSIRPSVDLDLLTVTADDTTGAGAAQIANAVAEGYQTVVRQQVQANADASLTELEAQAAQLQATIAEAEAQLDADADDTSLLAERDAAVQQLVSITNRADQIAVDASLFGSGVELFEEAEVPDQPSAPQPLRNAALAFVLGALAAGGLAWWRAEETATAEGRNDAAAVLGAPLLGPVPSYEEAGLDTALPTISAPKSAVSEAYHFLVGAIGHALGDDDGSGRGKAIAITSAAPTDGKTLTAMNFAIAAAQDGRDVLLIDADTRMRGMTRLLELTPSEGLRELAAGADLVDLVALTDLGDHRYLPVLPAVAIGDDTATFFRTPGFRRAMTAIREQTGLAVIDCPPLLLASDTSAVAATVDGIVVVVAKGTPLRRLEELRERLDLIGTPVLGYVFTKSRMASGYGYDAYGDRYGYGEDTCDADLVRS